MQQIDIRHTFHIPTAAWNILVRPKIELLPLHLSQWLIRDKGWLFTVNSLLSMFQKRRNPSTFLCENSQQIGWTTNLQTCWWYGLNPEDDFETTKSFWGVWWRRVAFTQQKPWMGLLCYGQTMLGLPKCSCGVLVGGYVERSSKSAKWNSQGLLGFKLTLQTWREKKRRMRRLILEQVFKMFVHDLWPCSTTFESSSKMFFQDHEWKRLKTQHFYMNYWQSFFWKRNKYFKRVSRAHADQCASKMTGQVFRNCTGLVSGKEPGCSVKIVLASMMHRITPQEFPNVPSCDLGGTFWYYPLHDVDSFLPWCWFPFF